MPKLWLILGLIYIVVAIVIFLNHFISLSAMWHWDEFLHHESFVVMTLWVGLAYLSVATTEYRRGTKTR